MTSSAQPQFGAGSSFLAHYRATGIHWVYRILFMLFPKTHIKTSKTQSKQEETDSSEQRSQTSFITITKRVNKKQEHKRYSAMSN